MSNRAKFFTKIVNKNEDYTSHNGEIVEILECNKGRDVCWDRYTIKFNDGTIVGNIMSSELDFDYNYELYNDKEIKKDKGNFTKSDIDEMYKCVNRSGNIYDGLAYLYSICKDDKELNKYITAKINYDTNNNSLNTEKLYAMEIIAMNNFETKYKELLGTYTMFTVDKDLLELEKNTIKKYPELKYDNNTKTFGLKIDHDKINNFFITYRCYPENEQMKIEGELWKKLGFTGIPITIGDENIEQIQKEMGELGVSIYQKYYDWYRENGKYEYTDYIDSFYYGKINEIIDILDEVIDFTEDNNEINSEDKEGIIAMAKDYKMKLQEYERTKEEQEI